MIRCIFREYFTDNFSLAAKTPQYCLAPYIHNHADSLVPPQASSPTYTEKKSFSSRLSLSPSGPLFEVLYQTCSPSAFDFRPLSLLLFEFPMAALTTRGSVDAALPSAGLEITTRTLSTSALPTGIPLLTRWSYPADCTQWLTFDPILGLANDPAIPTAFAVNYYSPRTLTADVDRGLWTMPSHTGYATCYPYSSSLPEGELYSPGICPDGQLIAGAVTENHYVITPNNTTVTRFEGKCCRRYVR